MGGRMGIPSFLEVAYATSPVPVLECSQSEWRSLCQKKGIEFGHGYGGYYFDMKIDRMPPSLIFVDADLSESKRLAVFYHELTHAQCRLKGCPCFTPDGERMGHCEHHAQVGSLIKCLDVGAVESLRFAIDATRSLCLSGGSDEPSLGAYMTVNHPFWEYCVARAGTVAPLSAA